MRAAVAGVFLDKGYAVTYPIEEMPPVNTGTPITFSLSDWKEDSPPQKGQVVILEKVQLFVRGWRASKAFSITPTSA